MQGDQEILSSVQVCYSWRFWTCMHSLTNIISTLHHGLQYCNPAHASNQTSLVIREMLAIRGEPWALQTMFKVREVWHSEQLWRALGGAKLAQMLKVLRMAVNFCHTEKFIWSLNMQSFLCFGALGESYGNRQHRNYDTVIVQFSQFNI